MKLEAEDTVHSTERIDKGQKGQTSRKAITS